MFSRSLMGCARLTYSTTRHPKLCPATSQTIANRMASTTENVCAEDEGPRCGPVRLYKSECMKKKRENERNPKEVFQFKNLIYKPECCDDPCPDVLPRFDDLYYVISDKSKIKYMRTWNECKSPLIKEKKVCLLEGIQPPAYVKRTFVKMGAKQRCEVSKNAWKLGLMDCKKSPLMKCPRIYMPGCKASRIPPECSTSKHKSPSGCKKRCTPYPSFSECDREPLRKGKPVECFCLGGASNCEVVLYLLMQKKTKKKEIFETVKDDIC